MSHKLVSQIIKELGAPKQIPLHIFLGALDIPGCKAQTFESLIEQGYDTLDYILSLLPAHFEQIDGVDQKLAQSIYIELKARKQLIDDLLSAGFTIGPFQNEPSPAPATSVKAIKKNSVSGLSFCFTGTMSQTRAALESYAIAAGGTIKKSVTSGLSYLVMASANIHTTKAHKARNMGIQTISEQDFIKMVGR